jgi:hypothetical protein
MVTRMPSGEARQMLEVRDALHYKRKVEDMLLSPQETYYKSCLHSELTKLLREKKL